MSGGHIGTHFTGTKCVIMYDCGNHDGMNEVIHGWLKPKEEGKVDSNVKKRKKEK